MRYGSLHKFRLVYIIFIRLTSPYITLLLIGNGGLNTLSSNFILAQSLKEGAELEKLRKASLLDEKFNQPPNRNSLGKSKKLWLLKLFFYLPTNVIIQHIFVA